MLRSLLAVVLLAGCAQAGVVPGDGRSAASPYPAESLRWSYTGVESAEEVREPIALSAPNPQVEQLAATKTAMIDMPAAIEGAVRFCVGVEGETREIATATATGDAKLDEVLRATVARWRFSPAESGSRRVEACATATFAMSFQ